MRLPPRALLYVGIGLVVAGLALVAFTWGRVAGLDSVPLQLPLLVSGGLTSLCLVLIGITAINIEVKLAAESKRSRQLGQVAELLAELHRHLGTGVTLDDPAPTTSPFEPGPEAEEAA